MAYYIVYSGGAKGYGLYEDENMSFPAEYREDVENLYVKNKIVGPVNDETDPFCYRFAPFKDKYLLSVIYKGCVCEEEKRPFFATVNWLFELKEAAAFLNRNIEQNIYSMKRKSDEVLRGMGYTIPQKDEPEESENYCITENAKGAVLSAAQYAMSAACGNGQLSAQAFIGCADNENLFAPLSCLVDFIPASMRRHVSFHIGATAAEETKGVALVIAYDKSLELMRAKGNFSGAMAVKKIVLIKDELSMFSTLTSEAEAYLKLSEKQRNRAKELFEYSNNIEGFWRYVLGVYENGSDEISGVALANLIGERGFKKAVENNLFTQKELLEIYKQKENLEISAKGIALIEKSIAPLIEQLEYEERKEKEAALKEREEKCAKAKSNKERKRYKKEEQEQTEEKKKKFGLMDFFKHIFTIALYWLVPIIFATVVFLTGILGKLLLPAKYLLTAYVIQIILVVLIAMPIGYLVVSLTEHTIMKRKRNMGKLKETKGEEEE